MEQCLLNKMTFLHPGLADMLLHELPRSLRDLSGNLRVLSHDQLPMIILRFCRTPDKVPHLLRWTLRASGPSSELVREWSAPGPRSRRSRAAPLDRSRT